MDVTGNNALFNRLTTVIESMPAFPESVNQVISMTSDINCAPKELVRVIESDPVMTMKLLKLVNSAFFALSRNVSSIKHALVYLGLNTVKNLAISVAAVDALPSQSVKELPVSAFLTHSIATALISQQLAKNFLHIKDASDYFVAGLVHDFGKAVLVQFEPKTYAAVLREAKKKQCPLTQIEIEKLGVSNAEVGAMLAESWQLPTPLVDSIRTFSNCDETSPDLTLAVAAANIVAKHMELGDGGNPCVGELPEFICQRLGADLETIVQQMGGLSGEIQAMKGMVQG
jgi:HD-like signal output (HDOD) protein